MKELTKAEIDARFDYYQRMSAYVGFAFVFLSVLGFYYDYKAREYGQK